MDKKLLYTKYACYLGCASQAAVICLSPLLFVTFHNDYGISYTRLGLLAVFNFCSQLIIDIVFSLFSRKFNIPAALRITPVITVTGLLIYAFFPLVFPSAPYFGIVLGTIVFSVASGLSEVLLSPTIAAIYKDNPEREMSKFHSVYAWGVVTVVIISTAFLKIFGTRNWHYLAVFWAILPVFSAVFFLKGKIPEMYKGATSGKEKSDNSLRGVLPFILCIFFGSAAENNMTQWCSSYIETALGIDKFWGDIFGLALFSVMLGISRTLYGKIGRNISSVMLVSFTGAAVCYLTVGLSRSPVTGLIFCVLCGLFVSMLWPGTIIWTENTYPNCGVVVFALLAAGGDFGASVAPQLMGSLTDIITKTDFAKNISQSLAITPEQAGLKSAMVISSAFAVAGVILTVIIIKKQKSRKEI